LTTGRQDFDEMGRLGVRELLRRIDGDPSPERHVTVSAELIVRASTGPAPA
jgi:DNA-binding LacI/PurR family transcriptional regulator